MKFGSTLLLLLFCSSAFADSGAPIYEALDDSNLGRLFLSPEERRALQRLRGRSKDSASSMESERSDAPMRAAKPEILGSGLIVSPSGMRLIWVGGEFRRGVGASASRPRMTSRVAHRRASSSGKNGQPSPTDAVDETELSSDESPAEDVEPRPVVEP